MKLTNYLLLILAVAVLALVGCGKSKAPQKAERRPGVVDLSDLQGAFPNPTPEVTTCIDKLRFATRYRTFDTAIVELDKLSRLPDLTDSQKKAVDEVIEQVKVAINANPAKPAQ